MTEAKRRAIKKYDAVNTVQFKLKLNKNTDVDILTRLEKARTEQGGKQGYIKRLIRKDIGTAE